MELLQAVQTGDADRVQRLLDEGADPNEPGYEGMTPLIVAAVGGHARVAAVLLEGGADIDRRDEGCQTALVHSIVQRNNDVTALLLERGADPAAENWLAFYEAVRFGDIRIVRRLLDIGADPNVREDDEPTPLMEAVGRGNLELVQLLLGAGADPRATAEEGMTTLDCAMQQRNKELIGLLEDLVPPGRHSLVAAVQAGNARMVKQLIEQGAAVNVADDEFSYTPLSWAAENGSAKIARLLIEAGADVNGRDWMNQTPLWTAVTNDRARVVRVLLEAGADYEITDDSGDSLLQSAVWSKSLASIRLLLEAGADPNTVRKGAPAALHWAVADGSRELIDLLLDAGADPDVALPKGRNTGYFEGLRPGTTPLMIAARDGKLQFVERLLEAGADWSRGDAQGKTAVDLATKAGRTEVLQRLEQAGAKVNYRSKRLHNAALMESVKAHDAEGVRRALEGGARTELKQKHTGSTPLMLACLDGNAEIVRLLLEHGANAAAHTKHQEYAITNAVVRGHAEAVRLLLAAGADVNVVYEPRSVPAERENCVILSRFCPLADAVAGGHQEITEQLLAAGADVNCVSPHGDSPLLAAVTSGHFDLARRLLAAGAQPREEDADYLDLLHWEERAASPAYQQSADEVGDLTGIQAEPMPALPGALSFQFTVAEEGEAEDELGDRAEAVLKWSKNFQREYRSLEERVSAVIDELRERIGRRGFHLLDAGMPLGCGPMTRFLVLVPTADHYAVMAAFGTHGNDDGLSNRDLIAWFREFEKQHPFALRGCKYDAVVIELQQRLDDPKTWAGKLAEFNPDICDDLAFFEKQLETSTRIHFWWD